jgi:hypothetical protein
MAVLKGEIKGQLSVVRAAGNAKAEYLPCVYCLGFFLKRELRRHVKRCNFRPSVDNGKLRDALNAGKCLLTTAKLSITYSDGFKRLLAVMRDDNISAAVKTDKLILDFRHYWYEVYSAGSTNRQLVSTKMRELGRLLIDMRERHDSDMQLADILTPQHFDELVTSTRQVAGFIEKASQADVDDFNTHSLALKLGYSLKTAAEVDMVEALKQDDKERVEIRRNFVLVYEAQWTSRCH